MCVRNRPSTAAFAVPGIQGAAPVDLKTIPGRGGVRGGGRGEGGKVGGGDNRRGGRKGSERLSAYSVDVCILRSGRRRSMVCSWRKETGRGLLIILSRKRTDGSIRKQIKNRIQGCVIFTGVKGKVPESTRNGEKWKGRIIRKGEPFDKGNAWGVQLQGGRFSGRKKKR